MASEFLTNEVISAFNEKLTVKEISKKLGCSEFTVRKILKNAGIKVDIKKRRVLERVELIKNLCENGQLTYRELSEKTGDSEQILRITIAEYNLEHLLKKSRKNGVRTVENAEKVKNLSHLTREEIAEKLGLSYANVVAICREYNIDVAISREDTLCWKCSNAYSGCSWSKNFKPVEGWKAKKTTVNLGDRGNEESYMVYECPMFKEG